MHKNSYKTYSLDPCWKKKGSKATNPPDSHGVPTYIVCNNKLNWNDKQGIVYPMALSSANPAWK